eukprot:RCo026743
MGACATFMVHISPESPPSGSEGLRRWTGEKLWSPVCSKAEGAVGSIGPLGGTGNALRRKQSFSAVFAKGGGELLVVCLRRGGYSFLVDLSELHEMRAFYVVLFHF